MGRRLEPGKLVLATHNPGKREELRALLAAYPFEVVPARALDLPEPEETGATFRENAVLKARAAATAARLPALADDSGVVVPALNGAPGIYTARWAGPDKDFRVAMERVERELAASGTDPDRRAVFVSVLALAWPDGHTHAFEGRLEGSLVWPPRGAARVTDARGRLTSMGPVFQPAGREETYAEIAPDELLRTNHRAGAFRALVSACLSPDS